MTNFLYTEGKDPQSLISVEVRPHPLQIGSPHCVAEHIPIHGQSSRLSDKPFVSIIHSIIKKGLNICQALLCRIALMGFSLFN